MEIFIWLAIIAIISIVNAVSDSKKKKRQQQLRGQRRGQSRPQPQARPTQAPPPLQARPRGALSDADRRLAEARSRSEEQQREREARRQIDQRRRQGGAPAGGGSMEQQMRQLYEQLTGQPASSPQARAPSSAPATPDPRIRVRGAASAGTKGRATSGRPQSVPPPPTSPRKPASTSEPIQEAEFEWEPAETAIQDIQDIEEMMMEGESSRYDHNTMGTRSMLVDLGRLKLPLMRIPMISMDTVNNARRKPNLLSKKVLREAVLARVILEQPKALQQSPNQDASQI